MKLVNKSSKVVFVGSELLMPDHSIEVGEETLNTPGVQALLHREPAILEIDNSAEKAAEAKKAEDEMRAKIAAEERAKIKAELKAEAEAESAAEAEVKDEVKAEDKPAEKPKTATANKPKSASSNKSSKAKTTANKK